MSVTAALTRTLLVLVSIFLGTAVATRAWAAEEVDFAHAVGPLLAKRCAACHDALEKQGGLDLTRRETLLAGGESGRVIVPGDAAASLAWQRITANEMPPKQPLNATEKKLIQQWIAAGAPWAGGQLDPLAYTTDQRAGYDWWSLQSLRPVPVARGSAWAINAIDAWIEQRLTASKLTPSPPADARTLVRRLYFDLLGLPPTHEELAGWVRRLQMMPAGASPELDPVAYDALVASLLASPRYGERWARHWLDVVRFGESQGFERDKLRPNAWRYRDWVIDAFNRDLPYDEFARLQLAGDVLRPNDPAALVATGFLVAGPWDEVGQKQQSAAMRAIVRQDELEDLVGTVGQTFLGLTVNCGRCHDHKFDPIRQREYFQLCAALAGVKHGEPRIAPDAFAEQTTQLQMPLRARLQAIETQWESIEAPHRARLLAARRTTDSPPSVPKPVYAWDFKQGIQDTRQGMALELLPGAYLRGGLLLLEGDGHAQSPPLTHSLAEKTLEVWLQLTDLAQRGGAALALQSLDGQRFDAIVFAEREPARWFAGSEHFARSQNVEGPEEQFLRQPIHLAITYQSNGTIALYRNGQAYGKPYTSRGLAKFAAGQSQLLLGLRHTPARLDRRLRCAIQRVQVYDRALSSAEIAASAGVEPTDVPEPELLESLTAIDRIQRHQLQFEREQLLQAVARLNDRQVYAVQADRPELTYVLHRGNTSEPREVVAPGGIASLKGLSADFQLPPDAPEPQRRRKLAEWITSRDNPLFARVIVNRLWHYHFGVGLVDTPNEFGFNGGRPSHPELLDWLAHELMTHDWSLKHLHRIIVCSATYRQASLWRSEAARVDAGNRLLWRRSPQRLEAETLRDTLLHLAGRLDEGVGGPGFYDFQTFVSNSQFYRMHDVAGPSFDRRTIYRTWVRSARSQLLDVFDCPDPSTRAPQRAVTTTPLQALSLANNAFVLRMADALAERVRRESGNSVEAQVRQLFRHAFGRLPDAEELTACGALAREHGISALCRAVINSNELLYVD